VGLIENFQKYFNNRRNSNIAQKTETIYNRNAESVPDFGGSRTTIPKFTDGVGNAFSSLPKRTQRQLGLDERRFNNMSVPDLVDTLIDAHPDVSFALWNFLRIGNCDYNIQVYRVNSKKRYKAAERYLEELIDRLDMPNVYQFEKSRSLKKVINQLILSLITRGAAALEVVLTPDYNDVAFFAPVDPATIEFKYENGRFVPYQGQGRTAISLDIPTFFYEGLDERIDDPYGRSPIISALSMVLFQLQVLNDIKAVVHNQGYPRFDIKIIEEVLLNRMPISIRNNEQEKQKWLRERLDEIIEMYNELEPDDTFVHFDSVEIGMVGGKNGSGGGAMIDPQKLMTAIDNLIMSGLKTLSTILGRRSTGHTESFAKLEIKLYLQGIKVIHDVVSSILSRALTLALNINGKQGIVKFEFCPVEIRTELEQEQFKQIKYLNLAYARDQGWIDQYEAANAAVGHDPVLEEPDWEHLQPIKNKEGQTPKGTVDTNPNAGGNTDKSSGS